MSERYLPADWTLPDITEHNRAFFCSGALMLQRCSACAAIQHPPLDVCHRCQGLAFDYVEAAGTGTIDNYSIVHHPGDVRLRAALPYNVVVVVLDDHPEVLVVGNVVNAAEGSLRIGAPVRCAFAEVADPDTGERLRLAQWELVVTTTEDPK